MSRLSTVVLAVALTSAGCERPAERRAERDYAARLLTGLLAYPQSTMVGIDVGHGAAQVTLSTPAPVQEVATWYRRTLRLNGWELVNDAVMNDGSLVIYAQRGARPLWITLRAGASTGPGTTYTIIGADTTAASADSTAAQRSGSSTSSNRIQRR